MSGAGGRWGGVGSNKRAHEGRLLGSPYFLVGDAGILD